MPGDSIRLSTTTNGNPARLSSAVSSSGIRLLKARRTGTFPGKAYPARRNRNRPESRTRRKILRGDFINRARGNSANGNAVFPVTFRGDSCRPVDRSLSGFRTFKLPAPGFCDGEPGRGRTPVAAVRCSPTVGAPSDVSEWMRKGEGDDTDAAPPGPGPVD